MCIKTEREALLQFKAALLDPYGMLSSWTTADCCRWEGIRCSNLTGHVLMLHLPGQFHYSYAFNSITVASLRYMRGEIHKSLMELQQLKYLNLSWNDFRGRGIPEFLGSLSNLRYLDLSCSQFGGKIPTQFGSLSHLKYLDLAGNFYLEGSIPRQLGNLSQLQYLDLGGNQFEGKIPSQIGSLSQLQHLDLGDNSLEGNIPSQIGNLSQLQLLNLRFNSLEGSIPFSLQELNLEGNQIKGTLPDLSIFSVLKTLDLSANQLNGKTPESSKFPSLLESLSIRSNNLEGGIPKSFGNACALRSLDMSNNSLSEEFPMIIHYLSGCARYSLEQLYLGMNQINGTLPDFSIFSILKELDLHGNKLNGEIPKDYKFPPQLKRLDMQSNSLKGVLTDYHFANMSMLYFLELSDNSLLSLAFRQNWVPPFQLSYIGLRSCKLGPVFPKWLETQNQFGDIDISNAGIADMVPKWFWANLAFREEISMNISYNNLHDLSHNNLSGEIPTGTQLQSFNASCYEDNLDLCGPPLEKLCIDGKPAQEPIVKLPEDENLFFTCEFYMSMAIGFVISFCGVFGSILIKRSWRHAYFKFISNLSDAIYVMAAVKVFKWCHRG
ncbi:Probably inactive leucine-rich repeat receptor-like protein kinase [Glycine soja]|uniref:Probably inactive leucine-rich repeat receptor-like protein kinase n=1 Tax=Glycine soja TaxID=3848 RepID=A0A0B2PNN3_GLYSO|nr:Probably inactive leucine-rich repeat receptor-like protein kinase [Glycine soja]